MIKKTLQHEFLLINLLTDSVLKKPESRFLYKILLIVSLFLSILLQGTLIKKWEQQLNLLEYQKQDVIKKTKQLLQFKQEYVAYVEQLNQLNKATAVFEKTPATLLLLFEFFEKSMPQQLFLTELFYHEKNVEIRGDFNGAQSDKDLLNWLHHFPEFASASLKAVSYKEGQYSFFVMAQLL